jgi:hypothetical protein
MKNMFDERTTFGDLHQSAAKVYRVATQSSTYLLGLYPTGARRGVVVRGEPGSNKEHVVVRDTDPMIGDRPLWDVPPLEWVGQVLQAGTMVTSRIRSVTEATDEKTLSLLTNLGAADASSDADEVTIFSSPKQAPRERRPRPPYPESHVQYAEGAASRLRSVQMEESLFADVASDPLLEDRLRVALAGCAVALETIRRKVGERRKA